MGNCVQPERTWADDGEWDDADEHHESPNQSRRNAKVEPKSVGEDEKDMMKRVKMRMSKKQLKELLLLHVERQGCSRQWRPRLQSIPEMGI